MADEFFKNPRKTLVPYKIHGIGNTGRGNIKLHYLTEKERKGGGLYREGIRGGRG